MKAVEYAARYHEVMKNPPLRSTIYDGVPKAEDGPADRIDVLSMICRDLAREAQQIMKDRRVQLTESHGAVMREQVEKSRVIARKIGGWVPEDFFLTFLKVQFPDVGL